MVETDEGNSGKKKSVVREYVEAIAIALVLALFIRTFVVQAFKIPSGSMIPTLLIGDHILVSKFVYGIKNPLNGEVLIPIGEPHRNDVVVFKFPENPSQDFIKRVIGVPGDRVEMRDKVLMVNGERVFGDHGVYKSQRIIPAGVQPRDNFGPILVPKSSLFVMGDNRDNSYDSRFWGFVDYKAVKGRAFVMYWSWDQEKFRPRLGRIGKIIN